VSRQREHLADAPAAEFCITDPLGRGISDRSGWVSDRIARLEAMA